jgi:hypothetical protein
MTQPPFPQPQIEPTGLTFEQYEAYTLEKLELWNGFYNYGGQDLKGFHLAVLTNMGLKAAVHEVPLSLWLAAIKAEALQNPKFNSDSETGAAMLNRLNRGLEDLNAVAKFLFE